MGVVARTPVRAQTIVIRWFSRRARRRLAKIVVIEDDLTFLDLLRVHLAGAGHEVLTAEDAALGLRAIIAGAPDLILLDLSVPYLDGFEMLEALRTDPATRNIPVIVLTGRGADETTPRRAHLAPPRRPT